MEWTLGVDVGGTFTDFYAFREGDAAGLVHKTPSTPDNPARAIIEGLGELCAREGIDLGSVARLAHGTTVATNALIERKGGRVALVTTEGFRDLLEIGRQTRPHMYSLQADHPQPLVPRQRRFEARERVSADGRALVPLDEDSLAAAVAAVRDSGAEACAVCFLFSFVNPEHERRVAEALGTAAPEVYVSLSSEVRPEFREYERLSTTVLNAYLQPVMARYLDHLERELEGTAPRARVGINQSNGGLMSIPRARRFPIRSALSGPAAGAVGACFVARRSGRPDVITLDMGGTSADVALVRGYETGASFDRSVAGFPVRLPMVDINTVGAGGGSVAWFDRDGLLKVGPESAGADPGPVCYGRGGDRPTVTDANLVLGRLSPAGLLGGRMALDVEAARAAFAPVADRLGFAVERTAHGVLGIVVANMVRAIRAISVERGHDPRQFVLMPFGGAGPLHAREVAASLGIREILVPGSPGILCAQGLVVADLKEDFVRSVRTAVADETMEQIAGHVRELAAAAGAWFESESVPPEGRGLRLVLDMRYVGQNFELAVAVDERAAEDQGALPSAAELAQSFFLAHETNYGFHNPDDPVEIVNFRLTARAERPWPDERGEAAPERVAAPAPATKRPVFFAPDSPIETPIYDRAELVPGQVMTGPAVVEQLDATTLLFPGDRLRVDAAGSLSIEVAQ